MYLCNATKKKCLVMENTDLKLKIEELKKTKNAIVLAHYYTTPEIQQVADFVGDSLQLARVAQNNTADIIVFAGVHFMGETAKILSPQKKVLMPDMNAGCSLADSCNADDYAKFIAQHPGHVVITYVNTTIGVKAHTDIICTSSNAVDIVNSVPRETPIIFGPDRNLGDFIKTLTGRENMIVWNGACHVHERFSLEGILELKKQNPDALVLTHPECKKPIHLISDHVGSTASLLNYAKTSSANKFIVVTEPGILFEMQTACPEKTFIPAPSENSTCGCNNCNYMKLNSLQKIYDVLVNENNEIILDEEERVKAEKSILRMLELSK